MAFLDHLPPLGNLVRMPRICVAGIEFCRQRIGGRPAQWRQLRHRQDVTALAEKASATAAACTDSSTGSKLFFEIKFSLSINKKSAVTENSPLSKIILSESGNVLPDSHFEIDCLETESFSASSSCDQPFSCLRFNIFSPMFIVNTPFLVLKYSSSGDLFLSTCVVNGTIKKIFGRVNFELQGAGYNTVIFVLKSPHAPTVYICVFAMEMEE